MMRQEVLNYSLERLGKISGIITEIERYGIHDGPGIRTVVFLKGCPLRCSWCCNPETQVKYIETAYFDDRCIGCGRCSKDCPYSAITIQGEGMFTDYTVCREHCYGEKEQFPCTRHCYTGARKTIGEPMTVQQLYEKLSRDISFYENTGGGITVSGGEPILQPEYLYAVLRYCKENWVDTALETCGIGNIEDYECIAPYLDTLFVDVKSMDTGRHKRWTGCGNTGILTSVQHLSRMASEFDFEMYVRVPVIPGFNDTAEDILEIGRFVRDKCPGARGVELLPYHKLGRGKYKSLGREYMIHSLEPPKEEKMDELRAVLLGLGLKLYKF